MITRATYERARQRAADILTHVGVIVRPDEMDRMEVVDFGLGELEQSGVQIVTLVSTAEVAAKLLVLFPDQTEPEHRQPPLGDYPGKHETIRCEWGELYLCGPGEATANPRDIRPSTGGTPTPCGTSISFALAIRSHSRRTHRTSSKQDRRAPSCGVSPPRPSMCRISSPI